MPCTLWNVKLMPPSFSSYLWAKQTPFFFLNPGLCVCIMWEFKNCTVTLFFNDQRCRITNLYVFIVKQSNIMVICSRFSFILFVSVSVSRWSKARGIIEKLVYPECTLVWTGINPLRDLLHKSGVELARIWKAFKQCNALHSARPNVSFGKITLF